MKAAVYKGFQNGSACACYLDTMAQRVHTKWDASDRTPGDVLKTAQCHRGGDTLTMAVEALTDAASSLAARFGNVGEAVEAARKKATRLDAKAKENPKFARGATKAADVAEELEGLIGAVLFEEA